MRIISLLPGDNFSSFQTEITRWIFILIYATSPSFNPTKQHETSAAVGEYADKSVGDNMELNLAIMAIRNMSSIVSCEENIIRAIPH